MKILLPLLALALAAAPASTCRAQAPAAPQLIPQPARMTLGAGAFTLSPQTVLVAGNATEQSEAQTFAASIAPALGFAPRVAGKAGRAPAIVFELDARAATGDEGYRLSVTSHSVRITASKASGLFYGAQTLRQLLPPQVLAGTRQAGVAWKIPGVWIEDAPRFAWRGMMLDSGRHFWPIADVKRFIDLLALHKLNTFHWHLTDDQGWRLEIKKYPRLTQIGSVRAETTGDKTPYGGFYTQAQAREIVAYAAQRHITVVPEIEMPGHASAAIASYPELGNSDLPNYAPKVQTGWSVFPYTFAPREETFTFLEDVLREVMTIFPSRVIHIGGDEAPKTQWDASPFAREFMARNTIKDGHALQSTFIARIEKFLNANGRSIIGWDEILEGGLAPNASVMSWRGEAGAREAAAQDHQVVMASNGAYYFDYSQGPGGDMPLRRVYLFEPAASIPQGKRRWLLGVQAQMWTEHIADRARLEYMAFPRACALAETAWSPPENKDYAGFRSRLETHAQRLQVLGVNFRALDVETTPDASWKSGEIGEDWIEREWDISPRITKAGAYQATFQFSGGAHRLDIAWAELLENGIPIARDEHAGVTGGSTRDNVDRFALPAFTPGAKYLLRAHVRADGGADSNGGIFIAAK